MKKDLEFIEKVIREKQEIILNANDKIWGFAELPYYEHKSAKLLCDILRGEGFTVTEGVAEIPTSFTATYGSGHPVMGVLGEYDALAALSQEAGCPTEKPVKAGAPGHGCGHCSLGTGALAAAIAVKEYLKETHRGGTIVYFGCAAEEGAGAKQFMARAGLFDDVDYVYSWHPGTMNGVQTTCSCAIMGANFEFKGLSSHAGGAPELGRSALDAAELMNVGVNYLREHMIDQARVHYAFVDAGGTSPNVVQDHALLRYEVRSPKVAQVKELFARVVNIAKGAALMTDTTVGHEITMAFSDYIPNEALAPIADACLQEVGAPKWDEADYALAKSFRDSLGGEALAAAKSSLISEYGEEEAERILSKPLDNVIHPFHPGSSHYEMGSTDVGDVGYVTPTLNISVATAAVGTVGHTWQIVGQSCSPIAHKGLLTAAKALALAAIRTMDQPEAVERAKQLVEKQNGGAYECPVPATVHPPVGKY